MKLLKNSIRKKLIILLIFSSIFPLSIAMLITYKYSQKNFNSEVISYNQNLIFQFKFNIDNYLSGISDAIYYPYSNSAVYNILIKKSSLRYDEYAIISDFMNTICRLSEDISTVYLDNVTKNTAYIYEKNTLLIFNANDDVYDLIPLDDIDTEQMIPTHNNRSGEITRSLRGPIQNVFTFIKPLYSIPQNNYIGIIAIDVKLDTLTKLSSQMISRSDEKLYLIDQNTNTVICSTDTSLNGTYLNEEISNAICNLKSSNGNLTYKQDESSFILFYETINHLGTPWLIIKTIPAASVYNDVNKILGIYLPTYLIFFAIAFLLIINVSSHFSSPIIELTRQMKNIKYGEPYHPLHLKQNDEIGILNDTFASMIDTINTLIINEYELKLSNKNAQLRMLQAQLNPHFLNNSLQSLGTLALQKESPELYTLITSLALMMNYVMDINHTLITLDKEFEYAENYLIFQHYRFGSHLHYSLNPSPETLMMTIPKMILQPLMENYFKHGFIQREEGYCIYASSGIEHDHLILTVKDNGSGMSDKELNILKDNLEKTKTFDNNENAFGIGLINIQSRLNLYYHNQARIEIHNRTPYGLEVKIILSLKEGNFHEDTDH